MFNSESWSKLSERAYGYKTEKFSHNGFDIFYSHVKNDIGEYLIAPSFGDFISINVENFEALERFSESNNHMAIKIKVCSETRPDLHNYKVVESGFIHQVEYNSHQDWRNDIIKCKFRNQIVQPEKKGICVEILSDKESLRKFYHMHVLLRINKFNEIPQPWQYFECIYDKYFAQNKGFVIHAYDPEGNLIAGILFIVDGGIVYYKFSASYLEALQYRPNNLLMDRLIQYCDEKGIKKLNLGFTGSSEAYQGLRKYKLHAGASEYPRYMLKTPLYSKLNTEIIAEINKQVAELIKTNPSLDDVDQFSSQYYKYFI